MSDFLPVVQKAQPFWVCLTCGTQEEEPAENCKQNSIRVAHYSVIEEERAGYEKREQNLKKQIEKIAKDMDKYANKSGGLCCDREECEIHIWSNKLLGLSKQ